MTDQYRVELPGGGGGITLQSPEEVDRWTTLEVAYREQYQLRKINDLTNLGMVLVQHINLYRAQQAISGRVPEVDRDELPTGRYISKVLKPAELKAYSEQLNQAMTQIRGIEKDMGIDKKSRDAAGDESLKTWLMGMKEKAYRYGLHVSKRTTAYDEFVMELRWRLRLNHQTGDAEDKHYEDCTDEGVLKWAREQLAELEEKDRQFAQHEGALVVGSA